MTNEFHRLQQCVWHATSSMDEFEAFATQRIARSAADALQARGVFRIVLAGGDTPRGIYRRLRELDTAWAKWQVYFGDERCLPPNHAERNSFMAQEELLSRVPMLPAQIHAIPAELGAEAAAAAYSEVLAPIDCFDLVLLGLGHDGHTASLFAHDAWNLKSNLPAALAVHHAPKPPPDRVSLSPWRLAQSRSVFFLVGEGKAEAVKQWQAGRDIPATWILPEVAVEVFLVDY